MCPNQERSKKKKKNSVYWKSEKVKTWGHIISSKDRGKNSPKDVKKKST